MGEPTKIPNRLGCHRTVARSLRGRTDQDSQPKWEGRQLPEKSTWENRPRFPTAGCCGVESHEVYVGEPTKIPNSSTLLPGSPRSLRGRTDQDSQQVKGVVECQFEVYVGEPTKIPNPQEAVDAARGSLRGRTDQDSQPVEVYRRPGQKSTWENRPRFPTTFRAARVSAEVYVGEPTKIPNLGTLGNGSWGSLRGRTDQDSQPEASHPRNRRKSTWENRQRFPTLTTRWARRTEVYVGEPTKIPNRTARRTRSPRSLRGRTDQDSQRNLPHLDRFEKSTWENRPRFPTMTTLSTRRFEVYVGEPTKIPNSSNTWSEVSLKSTWENRPRFPTNPRT